MLSLWPGRVWGAVEAEPFALSPASEAAQPLACALGGEAERPTNLPGMDGHLRAKGQQEQGHHLPQKSSYLIQAQ